MAVLEAVQRRLQEREETGEDSHIKRVCFVCTGNTCRSPMAEAVANALAAEPLFLLPETIRELASPELEAFSAGLYAVEGEPITEHAAKALEDAGIPGLPDHHYRRHRAHRLCLEDAERYDLLIGMTREHALAMMMQFPQLAGRITVMPTDIPDPFGGDAEVYRRCLEQITQAVRQLLFAGSEQA